MIWHSCVLLTPKEIVADDYAVRATKPETETISNFLDICIEDDKPKFAVLKRNNYFTDVNGNPYNFSKDLKIMDTKVEKNHESSTKLSAKKYR